MSLDEDTLRILEMDELLGTQLVVTERVRQILQEQWTPEHDHAHRPGDLLRAGTCYLLCARWQFDGRAEVQDFLDGEPPPHWPWSREWWKPSSNPTRNLEKGAALCCAELDREVCMK